MKLGSISTNVTICVWQQISVIMHQVSMQVSWSLVMNGKTNVGDIIVWGFQPSFQISLTHDCRSMITPDKGTNPFCCLMELSLTCHIYQRKGVQKLH